LGVLIEDPTDIGVITPSGENAVNASLGPSNPNIFMSDANIIEAPRDHLFQLFTSDFHITCQSSHHRHLRLPANKLAQHNAKAAMEVLGKWIHGRTELEGERVPPIRLLVLLHRLGYPVKHFPQKWISKMRMYRETLPPSERRSFDQEFFSLIPNLNPRILIAPTDRIFPHVGSSIRGVFKPFSNSRIWEIQQNFYKSTNLRAWRDVPYEISNNNLVCNLYMNQITRALESFSRPVKLCIVEVGAGHGILSLLLAQELSRVLSPSSVNMTSR
jgi:hypothetical protein